MDGGKVWRIVLGEILMACGRERPGEIRSTGLIGQMDDTILICRSGRPR